ncbi:HD family phosphohydrolase [Virgibacillus sp. W0181]|uniref:HD family phosphohydrolase n=1 Tax=Virgibacillus sp. W0181 TaxID=3391581 RepID=UPI003F46FCCE
MFKRSFKSFFNKKDIFNSKIITIFLPMLLLGIFFFLITLNNVFTETYDIERFNRAKKTIQSPITIENEVETKRKTRETVQAVADRYNVSEEVTEERLAYTNELFDAVANLDKESVKKDEVEQTADMLQTNEDKLQHLKQVLSPEINESIEEHTLRKLIQINPDDRKQGKKIFIDSLQTVLEDGVRTENIQSATEQLKQNIKYTNLNEDMKKVLHDLSEFAVVENSFFDVEQTMEARKEAASNVEPVIIRAGQTIVREEQTITNEMYEELKLVGLLDKERNIYPIIALGLLIILITGVIAYEMNVIHKKRPLDKGTIASILFISIITITLMKVVSIFTNEISNLFYAVPIATGALLIKQLIHERLSIVLAILYAILGSLIFNGEIPGSLNMEAGIYFLFSQLAGVIFLVNVKDRLAIVKSGIGIVSINIITVMLFLFLSFEKYSIQDILLHMGFATASALLSAILTIGLLPFFETGLGILSDMKLIALASPNQPLLKKVLTEAPGTYHHSVMVANLSETACEAIGANGLLARVGAYYHDVGKTVRPHYFIENQISIKNPHDRIPPDQSANIIISHPEDGAEMLRKHRMPKEIIDIALQHHGTTLLKYFYYKEKEKNPNVKEKKYRYPGPKPQTKEAAVICICDSAEAAVRSLKEPTEEKIEEIVSSIVDDRLMDGQLDETPLTLQELKTIEQTICTTLKGIFHTRIQYPMKEAK